MNRLLVMELKRLVRPLLVVYLVCLISFYFWDAWLPIFLVPAMGAGAASATLRRSAWYLTLPWSRVKLLSAVIYQNLIVFLISVVVASVTFAFSGKLLGEDDWQSLVFGTALFWLIGYLISFQRQLVGIPLKFQVSLNDAFGTIWAKRSLFSCVIILFTWKFELYGEPLYILLFAIAFLVYIYFCMLCEFVVPGFSLKKGSIFGISIGIAIFIGTLSTAIFMANFGKSENANTRHAIDILGRFPAFISDDRALDLFVNSKIGDNDQIKKHIPFIIANVTHEQWVRRTGKCVYDNCIKLSSELVDFKKIDDEQLGERFLALAKHCLFKFNDVGHVVCAHINLGFQDSNKWLAQLEAKEIFDVWLQSSDPLKQTIAIKGSSYGISSSREQMIRNLVGSKDVFVKSVATWYLSNLDKYKKIGADCDREKGYKPRVCIDRGSDFIF